MHHCSVRTWLAGLLIVGVCLVSAPRSARAQEPVDFDKQIRPILAENCFLCHGPDENNRKAKLRLDSKEDAFAELRGGGHALVAGDPGKSELIARIFANDSSVMPPRRTRKTLTEEQKQLLKRWIQEGAKWSLHWSFEAPVQVALPKVKDQAWIRNAIDHFILARLEKEKLRPNGEADRTTLIRRVTFDLTGLPPTPAEVDAFLTDKSPDAYEKVVDRLLNSKHFGEHMGRYWLDAGRYGDTHGLHLDNYREMWPYRDWVINAFNRNLPFDRFIIEQLAGDLLPDATRDQKVASGFNRLHVTTSEGGTIAEEAYVRNVVDRIDTTGVVFLGLAVGCARCHDHKFDPISSKEYYQLFAFFNNLDSNPLDGNSAKYAPIISVPTAEQEARLDKLRGDIAGLEKKKAAELAKIKDADLSVTIQDPKTKAEPDRDLATWLTQQRSLGGKAKLPKNFIGVLGVDPAKRNDAHKKTLREYYIEFVFAKTRDVFTPLRNQMAALNKERTELEKQIPTTLVSQENGSPKQAFVLKRGEYNLKEAKVDRITPAFLPPMPEDASKNRLGFAKWLVDEKHPLTARVAVNRFWQQCFGIGLVKTAEDFGVQGTQPSHPELLDWLAVQFIKDGWDIKKTMKRFVMSASYRQSSKVSPELAKRDPDNRLLGRGPRFRLDAEMLRDQALAVSGLLVEDIGGPSVRPPQPAGLWKAVAYTSSNTAKFVADKTHDKVHRRSLYIFWKRTSPPPQMTAFDAPSREACTVRRERTNTPLQALLLMNETQYVECARGLGQRAMKEGGKTLDSKLAFLFKLVLSRDPQPGELRELQGLYQASLVDFQKDEKGARELISLGTTQPDAALAPAELAAFTMVGNLVLNLDEAVNK